MAIKLENNNQCEYCGEALDQNDDVVIRRNELFHKECLPENLKSINEKDETFTE